MTKLKPVGWHDLSRQEKLAASLSPHLVDAARQREMMQVVKDSQPEKLQGLKTRMRLGLATQDPFKLRKEYQPK
jgi:hypothetical protein